MVNVCFKGVVHPFYLAFYVHLDCFGGNCAILGILAADMSPCCA